MLSESFLLFGPKITQRLLVNKEDEKGMAWQMLPWDLCVMESVTGLAAHCQHQDESRGASWACEEEK